MQFHYQRSNNDRPSVEEEITTPETKRTALDIIKPKKGSHTPDLHEPRLAKPKKPKKSMRMTTMAKVEQDEQDLKAATQEQPPEVVMTGLIARLRQLATMELLDEEVVPVESSDREPQGRKTRVATKKRFLDYESESFSDDESDFGF
jgi:hypothetical protein